MKTTALALPAATFVVCVGAEFLLFSDGGHGEFWWSHLPGFFALFGLGACLALIFFAKAFLGRWLQRKEDYYRREEADE